MLVHGVGVWDRSCRAHTVLDSIPSIARIIPKMRMMRGSGDHTIGGGGYVAQGLVSLRNQRPSRVGVGLGDAKPGEA